MRAPAIRGAFAGWRAASVAVAWVLGLGGAALAVRALAAIPTSSAHAGMPATGAAIIHHPLGDVANLALSLFAFAVPLALAAATQGWMAQRAPVPRSIRG